VTDLISKIAGPKNYPSSGISVPLNIFLLQEIEKMRQTLHAVKTSLENVINYINAKGNFMPGINNVINSIY